MRERLLNLKDALSVLERNGLRIFKQLIGSRLDDVTFNWKVGRR